MNLRDLQYLAATAQHLHFGKAAESCHVSQPTLSMQLKKLEDELGVQLFERNNKSVMLTPIGQQMVLRARQALEAAQAMRELAKQAKDPFSGDMRMGVFPTLGPYVLPRIVPQLKSALPKLNLLLTEEKTATLLELLHAGELDCALIALPIAEPGLVAKPIFNEPFLLAVPVAHTLAKRKTVSYEDLRHESLLLLEEGHCLREQALEVCHLIGIGEANSFRATSLETLRHMVAAGSAITLMPKLAAQDNNDAIRYIPFHSPSPARQIGLVWRAGSGSAVLFSRLSQLLRIKP
ncbi:MAG: LysR family transcriptional regulator [Proteobacteria bacterium]|nr:LysR family transcriptional regulator [Pseudomonadota bacterium]